MKGGRGARRSVAASHNKLGRNVRNVVFAPLILAAEGVTCEEGDGTITPAAQRLIIHVWHLFHDICKTPPKIRTACIPSMFQYAN